jgi:DNA-binding NtrC family response regulator
MRAMHAHDWPGNVRELINRIRRAMVLAEGRQVTPADLELAGPAASTAGDGLGQHRIAAERAAIGASLQRAGSNVTLAARDLGVSRMTLYRLMSKHGIAASR